MIRNSFIFLERISHKTEAKFWQNGITDWNIFLTSKKISGLSPIRKNYYNKQLIAAKKNLVDYNSCYFKDKLPVSEVWRLYDFFSDDCVFIDIETSGSYGDITVIGMYDGVNVMTLVKNQSLTKKNLRDVLSRYKMIVSFNGIPFDVPAINRYFNSVVPEVPHLDLRFPLAKLGFTGGLKKIEKNLGILRDANTQGLCGEDAINLWQEYTKTGNMDALNLLVEYNTEDVVNLKPLARFVFDEMKKKMVEQFKGYQ